MLIETAMATVSNANGMIGELRAQPVRTLQEQFAFAAITGKTALTCDPTRGVSADSEWGLRSFFKAELDIYRFDKLAAMQLVAIVNHTKLNGACWTDTTVSCEAAKRRLRARRRQLATVAITVYAVRIAQDTV